jgi:hypothetical protein
MKRPTGSIGVAYRLPAAGISAALASLLAVNGLFAEPSAAASLPGDRQIPGVFITGVPAVTETTSEIMARQARMEGTAPQETLDFFIGRQDVSQRKADPDAVLRRQGPAEGPQSPGLARGREPVAPQTVGVNADGPGSGATPCGTPPDTMGAVGPTQFISFVNCNLVSYNKATGAPDGVLNTTPNNFFNSVRNGSGTSDTHIRYDRTSQRWFLFIINVAFPNNRVLVAVSNSANITGATVWSFFFFQSAAGTHTSCLADYPVPGIDANGIYIGVNQFCGASLGTASYAGSDIFVVQKSSVLGAGPIKVTAFASAGFGTFPFTPHGVDNADPAATEGYLIGTNNFSWSQLDLIRVTNPGSTSPTLSSPVAVATANQGSQIPQPHLGNSGGSNGRIDASDNRLFAATYRDGSLWTAMGVGVTVASGQCVGTASVSGADRDAVFWWEIRNVPTGSTPTIRQAGIVCDTASLDPNFYSYGTIAPSGQGHAAAGFSIAGNNVHISAGTAGRLAGDTLSALQSINVYGPGAAAYNPSFDSGAGRGYRRWGDFSFTGLDPCNDMTLWTIQEYVPTANQYGTRFAELKGPPPATPASASPSSIAAGQTSASVVITGTPSSGSAFYDTPSSMSGEPCRVRIGGAVTGGVVVNSVTFTDATHVTLGLNTTGAAAGAKNVSVTNPDGQTSTGTGILTITSVSTTVQAAGLVEDAHASGATISNVNSVLEPGETVLVNPSWKNISGSPLALTGTASAFTGPAGATYSLLDSSAGYGTIAPGSTTDSFSAGGASYRLSVSNPVTRPAAHWDATFLETLSTTDLQGWTLHVGHSFTDVPVGHAAYASVENIFHNGVTTGCAAGLYCPATNLPRWQMAIFLARSLLGPGVPIPTSGTVPSVGSYDCTAGGNSLFTDVPKTDVACPGIHYIYAQGITTGCSAGHFCPNDLLPRWQMAIFLVRAFRIPLLH